MKGDHCNCIALYHSHKPGECDEPEPVTGLGVCLTCRYADTERNDAEAEARFLKPINPDPATAIAKALRHREETVT